MVLHGLKHIFQKPCPDLSSSERTQQLRSKTVYSGTVNLAKTVADGNNNRYKTYNGPYEVVHEGGNSTMIASQSYDDLLSITKGKVLLNQLPLNSSTQSYYQKNFGKGEMYVGVYNQFDPSFNFIGHTKCDNSVMVYDISANGFTGSYESGGFIGVTGPAPNSATNQHIFIDPDHCYYSDSCLTNASYTRFVSPDLAGLTGTGEYIAQQIINTDQYRGFSYPMPNFNLSCLQQLQNQSSGPLFCPPVYRRNTLTTTFPKSMYKITYLNSNGTSTSSPKVDGFTVYQFGVDGTIPLDTEVTHLITYSGSGSLDIYYAVMGGGGGGGAATTNTDTIVGIGGQGGGGNGGWWNTNTLPTVVSPQNGANVFGSGGGGAPSVLTPAYTRSSIQGANGGSGSVWIRFNSYAITN